MPTTSSSRLSQTAQRFTRIHFLLVAAFATQVIIYDAWRLLAPETIIQRWVVVLLFLATTTYFWSRSHNGRGEEQARNIIFQLIAIDIVFAGYMVYAGRGMASRGVFLFAIPLIMSLAIRKAAMIYATAIFSIIVYITAAVAYFHVYFNEGYKVELYGEVGFYSAMILICAVLLATFIPASSKK